MKTFLVLLLLPLAAFAQTDTLSPDDLRERAFQMAKATVEFLATDTKTYGYPDKTTCPDCVSYPSLKAFVEQQKLTKADELVNDTEKWASQATTTAKAPASALAELRNQLIERVTSGAERQHRRQLASFTAYENQMNQLSGQAGAAPASLAMNNDPSTAAAPDATDDEQNVQADTAFADEETVAPLSAGQPADNSWLSKSGLALILSLLSLGLAGWLLANRQQQTSVRTGNAEGANDMRVAQLNDELMHVKGDLRRAIDANGKLQNKVEGLENQVAVLQKAVGVASAVRDASPAPAPTQRQQSGMNTSPMPANPAPANRSAQTLAPSAPAAPPAPAENRPRSTQQPAEAPADRPQPAPPRPAPAAPASPQVLYARTVDLGDGFSADLLSEKTSERPMIYQLQIQAPGQATFRVADDPYAQRLALSDPYSYLNDACEYSSQPASNSRIQTTRPGRLALQGNKWVIQEKAQIAFS